jgi:hypothetical protein
MAFLRALAASGAVALGLLACGGSGDSGDAGADVVYGHHSTDAAPYEAEAATKTPWNRLTPHDGTVLSSPHLRTIYIGADGIDASQSFDAYIAWLVASQSWWGAVLAQYKVGYGTLDGFTRIDTNAFFLPGMVQNGFIEWYVLDQRIAQVVHGVASDAGTSDADPDASTSQLPPIPPADAYVFFLPEGVNVNLGNNEATCAQAGGYHDYDGQEPYAIIPPCGRYRLVVSHEIAEMVTDPVPGHGWYSDPDQSNSGGEIGDLCNQPTTVEGQQATLLWSNKDGDCEPL